MTREYIMRFQVDEAGHEYDMTRMQELVRCVDCKHFYTEPSFFHDYRILPGIKYMCRRTGEEIPVRDYYCRLGERRML